MMTELGQINATVWSKLCQSQVKIMTELGQNDDRVRSK